MAAKTTVKKTSKKPVKVEKTSEESVILVSKPKMSEKYQNDFVERLKTLKENVAALDENSSLEECVKVLGNAYYIRNSRQNQLNALNREKNPIIEGS